jgi:hypothetical protein
MATVTLRSDAFPVGTTVSIYPAGAQRVGQDPRGLRQRRRSRRLLSMLPVC